MKSTTPWQRVKMPQFPQLTGDMQCDVLIVGGGITGLSAAWLLKRAGKTVVVLERNRLGTGDTGCTTAHLTQVTDWRLSKLVSTFGLDVARLVWEAGAAAINTIEQIVQTVDAKCDFRRVPAFVHLPVDGTDNDDHALREDHRLANELGLAASYVPSVPHIDQPGIRFPNQAKFHPLRYLRALAAVVDGDGSHVFEQSEAREFSENPRQVKTEKGQVRCEYLVIATHVPLVAEAGLIGATLFQTKLAPYSTYAIGAKIPSGRWSEASYFDTADPYRYLRIDHGGKHDYAILGGEDHKTGQADDVEERHARLAELLKKLIPSAKVDHRWSGQVIETHDGLPYLGETANGQFAATGFAGNGLTFGTLGGMMACDAVCERENPWKELFDVNRKKVQSAWDFAKENVDYPYYLVRDRFTAAGAASADEVKRNEGKILKNGAGRIACSRDESGKLTAVSAVCTHMGCIVHWNRVERTWDCPCHGSRFLPTGEVLAGPAESPLERVEARVPAVTG
jgi:glycine/D-amino acid oxidase-like deaminating enzyme/nitrite reductase/ring-hydroxylating ferredoxin subunit